MTVFYESDEYLNRCKEITEDFVWLLLGESIWEARAAAVLYCAVNGYTNVTNEIGKNLLMNRGTVSRNSALCLAIFDSEESVSFIIKYLDSYLDFFDVRFQQLECLGYLHDTKNPLAIDFLNSNEIRVKKYLKLRSYCEIQDCIASAKYLKNRLKKVREKVVGRC